MHPYIIILLRWFLVAVAVLTAVVLGGTCLIDRMLPKVYQSTARVQVMLPGNPPKQPTGYQPEFETIQSPIVLNAVITRLDLKETWSRRVFKESEPLSDSRALAYLISLLSIDYKDGTNMIDISVSSDDPQEAADIANAVADGYKARREMVLPSQGNALMDEKRGPIIRIISRAVPGTVPIRLNRDLSLAVVIVVGLSLSLIVPTFVELGLWLTRAARVRRGQTSS